MTNELRSLVAGADQCTLALAERQTLSSRIATLSGSWLGYVTRLLKDDVTMSCLGKDTTYIAPTNVVISPCFFRQYACACCGRCCGVNTHLFYTGSEIAGYGLDRSELLQLGFDMVPITFKNHRDNSVCTHEDLFVSSWNVKGNRCIFQQIDKRCPIHTCKPIQCQLTPLHVDWSKKGPTVRLKVRLFGRNWRFGCKMVPVEYNPAALGENIRKLRLLKSLAVYYKLDTWLPEIIERLEPCLDPEHSLWRRKSSFSGVVIAVDKQIVKGVW